MSEARDFGSIDLLPSGSARARFRDATGAARSRTFKGETAQQDADDYLRSVADEIRTARGSGEKQPTIPERQKQRQRQFGSLDLLPSGTVRARWRDGNGETQTKTFRGPNAEQNADKHLAAMRTDIDRGVA